MVIGAGIGSLPPFLLFGGAFAGAAIGGGLTILKNKHDCPELGWAHRGDRSFAPEGVFHACCGSRMLIGKIPKPGCDVNRVSVGEEDHQKHYDCLCNLVENEKGPSLMEAFSRSMVSAIPSAVGTMAVAVCSGVGPVG